MNNWEDLDSFKKNEGDGEFKRRMIDHYYPIIYFGGNNDSFKYLIFIDNMYPGYREYIAQINEDGKKVSIIVYVVKGKFTFNNNDDLKKNLKKLKVYLDNLEDRYPLDFKIKNYLNELLDTINEKNEINKNERNKNRENYMHKRLSSNNLHNEI